MHDLYSLKSGLNFSLLAGLLITCSADAAPGGKGKPGNETAPAMVFEADKSSYVTGESAQLTWSSYDTKFCSASGDWTGKLPTSGSYTTPPLDVPHTYSLKCNARGGGVEQTLVLAVSDATTPDAPAPEPAPEPAPVPEPAPEPDPAPEPSVALSPAATLVTGGESVVLSWAASNTSSCTASGGWFGEKPATGSEVVGPLYGSTSFSLNCTGAGGSTIATAQVDVRSRVELSWKAPTENVDGSALTDLAEFRIYFGDSSRSYSETLNVTDPSVESQALELASGTWFFAMTAVDADGNESGLSNEVIKTAP